MARTKKVILNSKKKNEVIVKKDRVVQLLEDAIQTRIARNVKYSANEPNGEAYKKHGEVMKVLFPLGSQLKTPSDHNRWQNLNTIVGKLIRYVANYENGGHDDSMKDIAVYSQIQRELDELSNVNQCE